VPINSSIVGTSGQPTTALVDARWMMAYAAGLNDSLQCYFDTRRPEGIQAHPLFPVCFEWPAVTALFRELRDSGLTLAEAQRGVHASHGLTIHRPPRAGETLTTSAAIVGLEERKPGAYSVSRLETVGSNNEPICTTLYGTLYRGVQVNGTASPIGMSENAARRSSAATQPCREISIAVPAGAAHVYTECARIWNPIHTDALVAENAGLPEIILHGTATLALSVSRLLNCEANDDPRRVARIIARFGAMVPMPSNLTLRILAREESSDGARVYFETLNAQGAPAIRDGLVILRA
jgi:acyl dehydratase